MKKRLERTEAISGVFATFDLLATSDPILRLKLSNPIWVANFIPAVHPPFVPQNQALPLKLSNS